MDYIILNFDGIPRPISANRATVEINLTNFECPPQDIEKFVMVNDIRYTPKQIRDAICRHYGFELNRDMTPQDIAEIQMFCLFTGYRHSW